MTTLGTLRRDDLRRYARIDEDADEDSLLDTILEAARSYALGYTGLTADEAEQYPDLAVAALIVAADMYDNRQMTVDKDTVNPAVSGILGMHSRNLL